MTRALPYIFGGPVPGAWRLMFSVGLLFFGLGGAAVSFGQAPGDSVRSDTVRQDPFPAPQPAPPDSVGMAEMMGTESEESETAIVTADSLSAVERDGERVQELFDNVVVRQDTTRLRSNFGVRYLNRDEFLFTGDVVLFERGDTLTADTVRYNKRTKVGRATGNVRLTDGNVVVRAPRATYYTEEKRSVFPDSVTLVDSTKVLRAQEGTYWSNERRAEFQGSVRLTDSDTYLESDSLTYYRDEERSIATDRVFIRRAEHAEEAAPDTTALTYLFGNWVDNQEQKRYSRVEGDALLLRVRMDSTGAPEDSFAVRARQLEAQRTDTRRRLIAVDSVRIWQADLAAVADSAVYDRVIAPDTAGAPETPDRAPDTTRTYATRMDSLVAEVRLKTINAPPVTARSKTEPALDSTATGSRRERASADPDSARGPDPTTRAAAEARPMNPAIPPSMRTGQPNRSRQMDGRRNWESPTAESDERLPLEETRLFRNPTTWFERAQVWGDSIRVRGHERSLDTVYVRGSAFAAQMDTTFDRIQQLKGRDITAYFQQDSLRRIVARPNAQAIRFMPSDQRTLGGAAKASGDRITMRFRQGTVKRISVIGGVQSTYYRKPEDIPDPFRLEGFRWTPENKPTKDGLLREPRVRRKLDLGERARPPLAREERPANRVGTGRRSGPPQERFPGTDASDGPVRMNGRSLYRSISPDSLSVRPDSVWSRPSRRPNDATSDTTDTNNPDS